MGGVSVAALAVALSSCAGSPLGACGGALAINAGVGVDGLASVGVRLGADCPEVALGGSPEPQDGL